MTHDANHTDDGNEAPLGVVSSSSSDELAMAVERVTADVEGNRNARFVVASKRCLRLILSRLASQEETIRADGECLAWYGERARLARLIHGEGDFGRHALAADGGQKARARLAARQEGATQ